ncbi:MAG: hypothetical protein K2X77_27960 [Candidatus Obscuribacterales bacterium]|nr:hypothetical protein [Candidatus Obscuribacterales bacterium]
MDDMGLTADERRCLRMWFRQAIAIVEMEEAKRALMAEDQTTTTRGAHPKYAGRRARRSRLGDLVKQLV